MAESTKIYDLDQVSLIFLGIPIDGGFGEGQAISIEQLDPDFTTKVGADGSVARSKTNKRLTKVTVTLLQTSAGNAALSTLNNIDRKASNGAGVGPILIRDRQGTTLFAGSDAWIEGPPAKVDFGPEASNREWVIMVGQPDRFDGGN